MILAALGVTGLLVAVNAFYVASEFSSVGARATRVARLAEEGSTPARLLLPVLRDPRVLDEYIAACQVGITASSLLLGAYGEQSLAPIVERWLGFAPNPIVSAGALATALVLVVLTGLQIILGELVPKSVATSYPERLAVATAYPMAVSLGLFRPLIRVLNGSGAAMLRLLRLPLASAHAHAHAPEELELLVAESGRAGALDPLELRLLRGALELRDLVARQVMVPRNRLSVVDVTTPVPDLVRRVAASPYSRMPVYEEHPDAILGVVHLKDLLALELAGETDVRPRVRELHVVPEGKPVAELWQDMARARHYVALVIDEYGGTAGIVTQEDIIEEIFGEVQDEFDRERPPIDRLDEATLGVRGDVIVEAVNEALGVALPTDRTDTIGGLVVSELGRLAAKGDAVDVGGVTLEVTELRGRSVGRVTVTRAEAGAAGEGDGGRDDDGGGG